MSKINGEVNVFQQNKNHLCWNTDPEPNHVISNSKENLTLLRRVSKKRNSISIFIRNITKHSDPALFVSDLQDANKKEFFKTFFADYFLKVHLHQASKIESHNEVTKQYCRNQGFSNLFLLDDGRIRIQEVQKLFDHGFLTIFAWWWKSGSGKCKNLS
jgi:hypothetical protein